MREVMNRHARWEGYFADAHSQARVAIVFSRHTQDNYGGARPHARYLDFIRGWYCALQEAHIPFDVLSDKFIDRDRLQRYRVLVLSNLACVSDDVASVIEAFVAEGGAIVASLDAGLATIDGDERKRNAFADLIGGRRMGRREGLKSSYARIENTDDPLLEGIGDTDLIPNEGALVEIEPDRGSIVPLTLIPPVIAHSGATISIPEYSAIRETTSIPVVVRRTHGAGRVVYFCNETERLFYTYAFPDWGRVLANAVRWAVNEPPPMEVDAPDYVEVTFVAQTRRRLVHLVNLPLGKPVNTGWRHIGRNLVPVEHIAVRVRLDAKQALREARLASTEEILPVRTHGAFVEVVVPRLDDHEIVVFELQ